MLEDDIEPPVVRWFNAKTAALPEQMRRELGVWLEVMRNGSTTPPRSKPRADETIRAQLAFALPVLQTWAASRDSLREISRADVLAALPPSGPAARHHRAGPAVDLPDPASPASWSSPTPPSASTSPPRPWTVPPAVDLAALRDALDSPSPARAVITALLAYHAIRDAAAGPAPAHRHPRRQAAPGRPGDPARRARPRTRRRVPLLPGRDLAGHRQRLPVHPRPQLDRPPARSPRPGSASSSASPPSTSAWTASTRKSRPPAETSAPCATCSACPSPTPPAGPPPSTSSSARSPQNPKPSLRPDTEQTPGALLL